MPVVTGEESESRASHTRRGSRWCQAYCLPESVTTRILPPCPLLCNFSQIPHTVDVFPHWDKGCFDEFWRACCGATSHGPPLGGIALRAREEKPLHTVPNFFHSHNLV